MQIGGSNLSGTNLSNSSQLVRAGQNQGISLLLFGKKPPRLVDPKKLTKKQKKGLRRLELIEEQIADVMGVASKEFNVALCEGNNACVGRDGEIRFGVELLEEHDADHDLLTAVMAHEMGHQPWTWPEGNLAHLKKKQLEELYREEEAKADRFAGKALGALGLKPESIERFLLNAAKFEAGQSPEYYPAEVRAEMITEEWQKQLDRIRRGAKFNPRALERMRELR